MYEHESSDTTPPPDGPIRPPSFYDPAVHPVTRIRHTRHARDDAWIRAFVQQGVVAHIATRWEAQLFINPSTYWYDEGRHELFFHSNVVGRMRANSERHSGICLAISEFGRFLPSNDPVEMSVQYRSVVIFGTVRILDGEEARHALYGLLQKYFPTMTPGKEYRLVTDADLRRTSVYAIHIDSWSGKENWPEPADQTDHHRAGGLTV